MVVNFASFKIQKESQSKANPKYSLSCWSSPAMWFIFCAIAMCFVPMASCSVALQATGPSRGFTQLNGTGTRILNCDDCAFTLQLPFHFAFGSRNISKVSVFSNGVIELGLGGSSAASYTAPFPIPSTQPLPLAHIAIAQTDLAPNESVCTHHRRFIY
jgi:hypothetical protein